MQCISLTAVFFSILLIQNASAHPSTDLLSKSVGSGEEHAHEKSTFQNSGSPSVSFSGSEGESNRKGKRRAATPAYSVDMEDEKSSVRSGGASRHTRGESFASHRSDKSVVPPISLRTSSLENVAISYNKRNRSKAQLDRIRTAANAPEVSEGNSEEPPHRRSRVLSNLLANVKGNREGDIVQEVQTQLDKLGQQRISRSLKDEQDELDKVSLAKRSSESPKTSVMRSRSWRSAWSKKSGDDSVRSFGGDDMDASKSRNSAHEAEIHTAKRTVMLPTKHTPRSALNLRTANGLQSNEVQSKGFKSFFTRSPSGRRSQKIDVETPTPTAAEHVVIINADNDPYVADPEPVAPVMWHMRKASESSLFSIARKPVPNLKEEDADDYKHLDGSSLPLLLTNVPVGARDINSDMHVDDDIDPNVDHPVGPDGHKLQSVFETTPDATVATLTPHQIPLPDSSPSMRSRRSLSSSGSSSLDHSKVIAQRVGSKIVEDIDSELENDLDSDEAIDRKRSELPRSGTFGMPENTNHPPRTKLVASFRSDGDVSDLVLATDVTESAKRPESIAQLLEHLEDDVDANSDFEHNPALAESMIESPELRERPSMGFIETKTVPITDSKEAAQNAPDEGELQQNKSDATRQKSENKDSKDDSEKEPAPILLGVPLQTDLEKQASSNAAPHKRREEDSDGDDSDLEYERRRRPDPRTRTRTIKRVSLDGENAVEILGPAAYNARRSQNLIASSGRHSRQSFRNGVLVPNYPPPLPPSNAWSTYPTSVPGLVINKHSERNRRPSTAPGGSTSNLSLQQQQDLSSSNYNVVRPGSASHQDHSAWGSSYNGYGMRRPSAPATGTRDNSVSRATVPYREFGPAATSLIKSSGQKLEELLRRLQDGDSDADSRYKQQYALETLRARPTGALSSSPQLLNNVGTRTSLVPVHPGDGPRHRVSYADGTNPHSSRPSFIINRGSSMMTSSSAMTSTANFNNFPMHQRQQHQQQGYDAMHIVSLQREPEAKKRSFWRSLFRPCGCTADNYDH